METFWIKINIILLLFTSFLLSSVKAQVNQVLNDNYCFKEVNHINKIQESFDVRFLSRAKEVVSYWSERMPQKRPQHKIYQAIAAYEVGKIDLANQIVDDVIYFNYEKHSQPHVGAFISMPLTYAYMRYGELMGDERKSILIKKVKSFDPFSGASENHKLLNISAAYILAEFSPQLDWKNYSNQEVYQKAKNFLEHEAKDVFEKGLWEFDSSNYIMFHINSWILLYDFATDAEIKKRAKFSLDSIFAGIAPEIIDGTWAASTYRTYTPINANYRDQEGNITFTWLAFGHRRKSMGEPRIIILAVSDYRIPQEIVAAAITRDESILPYEHKEKHSRVRSGKYPFYKYSWIDRGYGIYSTYDGNEVTEFKTDQYHKWGIAWNRGYFVLKDLDIKRKYPTGDSPYNQVLQYQNVILGVTIKPENIQRYQENISDNIFAGGWEFMTGGDSVYIAFYQVDNYRGWIVETSPKNSFATLEEFAAHIIKKSEINLDKIGVPLPALSYKTSKGDRLSLTYQNDHSYINKKQKVNGKLRNYQSWPVIKNPWMRFNEENQELILIAKKVQKQYSIKDLEIRCIHNQ